MTRLATLTAGNMLLNRAVIYGMLEGKSLIRFTIGARHTSGVQVEIKKALREGSIFLNEPRRWKTRLQLPIRIRIENNLRLRLLLNHSKDTLFELLTHFCYLAT